VGRLPHRVIRDCQLLMDQAGAIFRLMSQAAPKAFAFMREAWRFVASTLFDSSFHAFQFASGMVSHICWLHQK
jgi:hypothetical protein